jgi:Na+-driven multidrug efflux pump
VRLRSFIGSAYLCSAVFAVAAAALLLLARRPLLSLYVSEPGAVSAAELRMRFTVGGYFLCAWMECGAQILRGLGKSATSALITFVLTCVGRVAWIYTVFEHFGTLESIFISYPVTWGLAALVQFIALYFVYRKRTGLPLIALRKNTQ